MNSGEVATFIGFSAMLTVFSVVSIVILYCLSRYNITGLAAFGILYLIWIVVIGVMCFTGGDE